MTADRTASDDPSLDLLPTSPHHDRLKEQSEAIGS